MSADTTGSSRADVRKVIARHLQRACSTMPMTIAVDDSKALILAELILRDVEELTAARPSA